MARIGQLEGVSSRVVQAGYPSSTARFDWMMTALSTLFVAGLWVDGWAHFHGEVDGSFFTPWHFLFYSAFGVVALFLAYHQVRNVNRGYGFWKALPKGYLQALIGVGIFALSGAGDMVWHTLFGIENGTEALMSPSHIGLAVGMILVCSGAVRSVWSRGHQRGWRLLGPMIVGITLMLTLILFFTSYANPTVTPYILMGGRVPTMAQDFGVTSILFTALLLSLYLFPFIRRWVLPFGTFTVVFGVSTALLTLLNDFFILIPGAVIAGLLIDVIVGRVRPSQGDSWRLVTVMFVIPVIYFAQYFISVGMVSRIPWSIHVWSGSIFIAGVMGASVAIFTQWGQTAPSVDEG